MKHLLFTAALGLASAAAIAGPAEPDARLHFAAIASGDLAGVMRHYDDTARLNWIGGPLNGQYSGNEAIRATWAKFIKAAGPLTTTITDLQEAGNGKGSTVTANVTFEGKMATSVFYVLTYRDHKLVNETWQITPQLAE